MPWTEDLASIFLIPGVFRTDFHPPAFIQGVFQASLFFSQSVIVLTMKQFVEKFVEGRDSVSHFHIEASRTLSPNLAARYLEDFQNVQIGGFHPQGYRSGRAVGAQDSAFVLGLLVAKACLV
jgi:hypothetical protein